MRALTNRQLRLIIATRDLCRWISERCFREARDNPSDDNTDFNDPFAPDATARLRFNSREKD